VGNRLVPRRFLLLLPVVAALSGCSRDKHEQDDEYVLAVLLEGNRPEVMRAIADERGVVVLDIKETGTLRVTFGVHSRTELLAIQQRLRDRGITATVPAQGVPLAPS
jgi:hypothetical protein